MKGKILSRELSVAILIVLGIVNAAVAITLFGTGLWILGLFNAAASLYAMYTLHRMS